MAPRDGGAAGSRDGDLDLFVGEAGGAVVQAGHGLHGG